MKYYIHCHAPHISNCLWYYTDDTDRILFSHIALLAEAFDATETIKIIKQLNKDFPLCEFYPIMASSEDLIPPDMRKIIGII